MRVQTKILVLFSLFCANALAINNLCSQFYSLKNHEIFTITERHNTAKDIEPVFKKIFYGEPVTLVIPSGVKTNFSSTTVPARSPYEAGQFNFFPYELKKAVTDDEKYRDSTLTQASIILGLQEWGNTADRSPHELWGRQRLFQNYVFSRSPTANKSGYLYQHPDRIESIIERSSRMGRNPIFILKENGDRVFTTEHFLRILIRQGQKQLSIYRGHHSFDYFFYRLLLPFSDDAAGARNEFANWLEHNKTALAKQRNVNESWILKIADSLKKTNIPTETILAEIIPKMTTATLFTSLTNETSDHWAKPGDHPEVLHLSLNLETLPDWYLEQIQYGSDMEIEMSFPFATTAQRAVLRQVLSIQR